MSLFESSQMMTPTSTGKREDCKIVHMNQTFISLSWFNVARDIRLTNSFNSPRLKTKTIAEIWLI